jgi:hypothetical protein
MRVRVPCSLHDRSASRVNREVLKSLRPPSFGVRCRLPLVFRVARRLAQAPKSGSGDLTITAVFPRECFSCKESISRLLSVASGISLL